MTKKSQGPPEPPVPETTQPTDDRTKEFSAASTDRPKLDTERKFLEARLALVQSDPNLSDDQKKAAIRDLQRRVYALQGKENKG